MERHLHVAVDRAPRGEDRRFICRHCAMKWYVPGDRPELPDIERCSHCGGPVAPLHASSQSRPPAASAG